MTVANNPWSPPPDLGNRKLLVVAYTDHYFGGHFGQNLTFPDQWELDLSIEFSYDISRTAEADAIWFHAPSIRNLPKKIEGQKWIIMSMESAANYPFLRDKKIMSLFDIQMTYRLDSDVPVPYCKTQLYNDFLDLPVLSFVEKREVPLLFVASNPVKQRDTYAKELSRYIPIDCPGKCLNNQSIDGFSDPSVYNISRLQNLIGQYKFYLCLENSNCTDYVTEKLYMPLAAGTVPVYQGANNVTDLIPQKDSIICTKDFASPKLLANYLLYLSNNATAYQQILNWKNMACTDLFKRLVEVASIEPLLRMFIKLAHGCEYSCTCGGRLR